MELTHGMIVRGRAAIELVEITPHVGAPEDVQVTFWSTTTMCAGGPVGMTMRMWQAQERAQLAQLEVIPAIPWVSFTDAEGKRWYGVLIRERVETSPEGVAYSRVRVHGACEPDEDWRVGRLAKVPYSQVEPLSKAPFPDHFRQLLAKFSGTWDLGSQAYGC